MLARRLCRQGLPQSLDPGLTVLRSFPSVRQLVGRHEQVANIMPLRRVNRRCALSSVRLLALKAVINRL
jgi:hypothetical protein